MALFEDTYDLWISKRLTQQDAARMLGVSDRTFRRWTERHDDGGGDALIDRRLGRGAHNETPALSANITETPAPFGITVGRWR